MPTPRTVTVAYIGEDDRGHEQFAVALYGKWAAEIAVTGNETMRVLHQDRDRFAQITTTPRHKDKLWKEIAATRNEREAAA